jgi:hypothetical protein
MIFVVPQTGQTVQGVLTMATCDGSLVVADREVRLRSFAGRKDGAYEVVDEDVDEPVGEAEEAENGSEDGTGDDRSGESGDGGESAGGSGSRIIESTGLADRGATCVVVGGRETEHSSGGVGDRDRGGGSAETSTRSTSGVIPSGGSSDKEAELSSVDSDYPVDFSLSRRRG